MVLIARGIERRARAEGLIDPMDTLVAVEAGDLNLWTSSGKPAVLHRRNCAVGYTADRLVIVGTEQMAAVDLLMLYKVEVSEAIGWLTVTYLHDRDSYRTTFEWAMTRRREAADFATGLEAAANRRRTQFPQDVQDEVRTWGMELDRRIEEHIRVTKDLAGPIDIVTSIPAQLDCLAFVAADTPAILPTYGERVGELMLLADDTFVLTANVGIVARFSRAELTCLAIRDNFPSLLPSAAWEIGYQSAAGERHLFFEAPGVALWPGMIDVGADTFLHKSQLIEAIGTGDSWLHSVCAAPEPSTPVAAAVRPAGNPPRPAIPSVGAGGGHSATAPAPSVGTNLMQDPAPPTEMASIEDDPRSRRAVKRYLRFLRLKKILSVPFFFVCILMSVAVNNQYGLLWAAAMLFIGTPILSALVSPLIVVPLTLIFCGPDAIRLAAAHQRAHRDY